MKPNEVRNLFKADVLRGLRKQNITAEFYYHTGECMGSGVVQYVRGYDVTIDDRNGGAFGFNLEDVTNIDIDQYGMTKVTVVDWQSEDKTRNVQPVAGRVTQVTIRHGKEIRLVDVIVKPDMVMRGETMLPGIEIAPFEMEGVDVDFVRECIAYLFNEGGDTSGVIEEQKVFYRIENVKALKAAL